ncbi:MAG: nitroreductase family protein [Parachlamydiales bacterium]|nr:nitroreductase family protein [Parachlamydiales bacterium]
METLEAIFTRRSIRKFQDKKFDEKMLLEILKAGMYAPSAYNQQPWQFIVIDDRKLLDEIPKFHPYSNMLKTAPLAILVCADLKLEVAKDMWIFDCAAATQNILLAAHALGLGSVWLGCYLRDERVKGFKKLLNLPDHIIPISLIPIGYPSEEEKKVDRFKKDRIHKNKFK